MSDTDFNRIADMAGDDRPREKAWNHGIRALTDTELLAIVFGSGMRGKSVLEMSRDILRDNDNHLGRLARVSPQELCRRYKGIGRVKAIELAAAIEIGSRAAADQELSPQITGSDSVYQHMRTALERLNYEEFWVVYLNRANRIMAKERLSQGGTASTVVDVKLLAKKAIDQLAAGIILVHNHPSGTLRPSAEDERLTRRIVDICRIADVAVLDHLIIAPSGFYSFRDNGNL